MSPHRIRTISRSPVSRFSRTIGWNVCGATFQLGPKSGMTGPWIANSSASSVYPTVLHIFRRSLHLLIRWLELPRPIKPFQPPQLQLFRSRIRFRFTVRHLDHVRAFYAVLVRHVGSSLTSPSCDDSKCRAVQLHASRLERSNCDLPSLC